jgi:hypothetical protein
MNDSKLPVLRFSDEDRERLAARLAEVAAPLRQLREDAARVVKRHRRDVEWTAR